MAEASPAPGPLAAPLTLAVVSDTHLREPSPWFERVYAEHLAGADALIHCGDIVAYPVYSYLLQHPNFHAVSGNMCEWRLADELPSKLSVVLGGLAVGVTHGWGKGLGMARELVDAFGPGYDLVCFGHTHRYEFSDVDNVKVLNPGCLQENRFGGCGSLALVRWDPEAPEPLLAEQVRVK